MEALTFDQLRLFLMVAEVGSFSAAGRQLGKVQSVVSYAIGHMEQALEVKLFERRGRRTPLTPAGKALAGDARRILNELGQLRAHAANLAEGVESDVSIVADTIFPEEVLVSCCRAFQIKFPAVCLQVHIETLNSVVALVLDGTCQFGIGGPVGTDEAELERRFLSNIALVPVAASDHALSRLEPPISTLAAQHHVQIVITERNRTAAKSDHTILSGTTWRVADAPTKLALIRSGLGWGNLPFDMIRDDLETGLLTRLVLAEWGDEPILVPLCSMVRIDKPRGVAADWLLRRLETACEALVLPSAASLSPKPTSRRRRITCQ